jgi:stage II sporulation protein P
MQREMNRMYPTLAKPIELSRTVQPEATLGSMIVEIGCTGNTLQESLTAARYFATRVPVLLDLY